VGEFLILLGAFKAHMVLGIIAASGVVFAACYMLWMFQRVVFGQVTNPANENLKDINWRERIILIPLVALIFWIGIYPKPFFDRIEPAAQTILNKVGKSQSVELDTPFRLNPDVPGEVSETVTTVTLNPTEGVTE